METWFPTFVRLATSAPSLPLLWSWRTTLVQQRALLRLIAVALEENLPITPLLEQWADDESGLQRLRVRRMARLISEGRPLADAAEAVPGVLRDEDILTLRFDAQSGTRTAAIRDRLENLDATGVQAWQHVRNLFVYFGTVLAIGLLLMLFARIRILPVLDHLLSNYGLHKSVLFTWAMSGTGSYANLFLIGALILLGVLIWLFATRAGRQIRWSLAGKLFRSVHELRAADVLQKLRVAAMAGRPIPGGVSTLARFHFDPTIRHELLVVRNDLEQGIPVWQSMSEVGLLSVPEANLLAVSDQQGSPAWALAQVVEVKRQRVAKRVEWAGEFLLPAMVLLVALLVIFQVCVLFLPLIHLLEGLL